MKAIFETDDPEEAKALLGAMDVLAAARQFDEWLRTSIKHGDKDWQEVRDRFWEEFGEWLNQ